MEDTRKNEGLKALGSKTKYKMDYAPEVLETYIQRMITGYNLTVQNSHLYALSQVNQTLRRLRLHISRKNSWWKVRA